MFFLSTHTYTHTPFGMCICSSLTFHALYLSLHTKYFMDIIHNWQRFVTRKVSFSIKKKLISFKELIAPNRNNYSTETPSVYNMQEVTMVRPEELAPIQQRKFERYRELLRCSSHLYVTILFDIYRTSRGCLDSSRWHGPLRKDKLGDTIGFWDVVVITAADDEQAEIYREQVRWRQELGQIPSSCTYHVVPDPPGCKIGNGGATLVVLDYLRTEYQSNFAEKKYLVIHAGGYSQRTPQHSVCGKIFAPLPVGPLPGSSMLEMCFAMLCDIPSRVFPGAVMIKCGDDVIIFDGDVCQWDL